MALITYQYEPIKLEELTVAKVDGSGAFDVLMQAMKGHLEQEFTKGRIKGPEYSTVYLGALQSTMATALDFLTKGRKAALEALLLEKQIELAGVEKLKAEAELQILLANVNKIPAEIAKLTAETRLVDQNTKNAEVQNRVLEAEICKLKAEYDILVNQIAKAAAETALLNQKVITEKAQTDGSVISPDSILGKQVILFKAQADGFQRDAEQKAAKLMIDTWSVRRGTDEGVAADSTNKLADTFIGQAVTKLLAGVEA